MSNTSQHPPTAATMESATVRRAILDALGVPVKTGSRFYFLIEREEILERNGGNEAMKYRVLCSWLRDAKPGPHLAREIQAALLEV